MKKAFFVFGAIFFLAFCFAQISMVSGQEKYDLVQRWDVAKVWSGHPVGFALQTHKGKQFVAFYDEERYMTIGMREVDADQWAFKRLDSQVGWDSHNYIAMTFDKNDCLHVAGNMHCVPLIYFRAEKPLDIDSLAKISNMVGQQENRCTYPRFVTTSEDDLLFVYRDGGSGNGDWYWNIYDPETRTWKRFLDKPLFDGEGDVNAYYHGPIKGPDGKFHLCWMWRETPDCSTNHLISYAKSTNMRDWEKLDGTPVPLPMTRSNSQIIDPVPSGGGLFNPAQKIGFDTQGRVIISYTKYDENGNLQLINARAEDGRFKLYQTSDWDYRWEFKGNGSVLSEVSIGHVQAESNGTLTQSYSHAKYGNGRWLLDPETLKPIGKAPSPVQMPGEIGRVELERPGMGSRGAADAGKSDEEGVLYSLRWETLPTNRDRPHENDKTPPPSTLRIFKVKRAK